MNFSKQLILPLLTLLLATAMPVATAGTVLADWNFSETAGTGMNNTLNSGAGVGGPGGTWNVAITSVHTSGAGTLVVGNDGKGGSGTRSGYADLGPDFAQLTSGTVSLFARLSDWSSVPGAGQSLSLGLIEGNDFLTAGVRFHAGADGFALEGLVDDSGNGGALGGAGQFASFVPLTIRMQLDLDLQRYALADDTGAGFMSLGSAAIDSFTGGVNSLRFGSAGDFSGNALHIDRIWLVQEDPLAVPEPAGATLFGAALAALLLTRARRRR